MGWMAAEVCNCELVDYLFHEFLGEDPHYFQWCSNGRASLIYAVQARVP